MSGNVPSFFVGTPFVIRRRNELNKSDVLDSEGRGRFHGAFEGGFSAGYYNTVGSAQGWKPSQYVRGQTQSVEDFMDEEDDALMGDKVQASAGFKADPRRKEEEFSFRGLFGIPTSDDRKIEPLSSIGKRLFALCLNKESRKQRYLQEEEVYEKKKRAPVLTSRQGLGYVSKHSWSINQANRVMLVAQADEEEEHLGGHKRSEFSHEIVEVDDDDDDVRPQSKDRNMRLANMVERMINRKNDDKKAYWPDGVLLPTGYIMANQHDPNKLMLEKKNLSTKLNSSLAIKHDFGALRPSGTFVELPQAPPTDVTQIIGDAKLLISQKFMPESRNSSSYLDAPRSRTFTRRISTWIPNAVTKKMFGVEESKIENKANELVIKKVETTDGGGLIDDEKRANLNELRMVFQAPQAVKEEEEFYSSDDSNPKREDDRSTQNGNERTASSSEESRTRKRLKKSKKKHKKNKKKKRIKRSSSSSESSDSSESLFVMELK